MICRIMYTHIFLKNNWLTSIPCNQKGMVEDIMFHGYFRWSSHQNPLWNTVRQKIFWNTSKVFLCLNFNNNFCFHVWKAITSSKELWEHPRFDESRVEASPWCCSINTLSGRRLLAWGDAEIIPLKKAWCEQEHIRTCQVLTNTSMFTCNIVKKKFKILIIICFKSTVKYDLIGKHATTHFTNQILIWIMTLAHDHIL